MRYDMTDKLGRKLKEFGNICQRSQTGTLTSDYNKIRKVFESGALMKGYSLDQCALGFYKDTWLQEAWEIFNLVDLRELLL